MIGQMSTTTTTPIIIIIIKSDEDTTAREVQETHSSLKKVPRT
jgi:hypothetical protein